MSAALGRCDGCEQDEAVRPFVITASALCETPGEEHAVIYCEGCAELAAWNWTGEIATLRPVSP